MYSRIGPQWAILLCLRSRAFRPITLSVSPADSTHTYTCFNLFPLTVAFTVAPANSLHFVILFFFDLMLPVEGGGRFRTRGSSDSPTQQVKRAATKCKRLKSNKQSRNKNSWSLVLCLTSIKLGENIQCKFSNTKNKQKIIWQQTRYINKSCRFYTWWAPKCIQWVQMSFCVVSFFLLILKFSLSVCILL